MNKPAEHCSGDIERNLDDRPQDLECEKPPEPMRFQKFRMPVQVWKRWQPRRRHETRNQGIADDRHLLVS